MVRKIDGNSALRIRSIGGINLSTLDGETVTVHTREGKDYTGLFLCSRIPPTFSRTRWIFKRP
ncbi:MAG: hypothetical protein IJX80_08185 [Clostridia bacterium]|nr:hypothetical protein [Clostridia bacterium]